MIQSTLSIQANLKPFPYKDQKGNSDWGEIKLIIFNETESKTIFQHEWALTEFFDWLLENKVAILNQDFFFGSNTASITQRINEARDQDFEDLEIFDKWYERIFQYYKQHSLRMAFRGAEIPDIIIGYNGRGVEISLLNKWSYTIDGDTFYLNVEKEHKKYLKEYGM